MAVENYKADHSWSTGGRNGKGSTTSNKNSGNRNSGSSSGTFSKLISAGKNVIDSLRGKNSGSSSGNGGSSSSYNSSLGFDQNKDYAAAIKAATSQSERDRLIAERQNKLNWMNQSGNNKNGYTNDIYKNKAPSSGTSYSGGAYGGFDPAKDYAAAMAAAKSQVEYDRLKAERELKIAWLNATGNNTGNYTNDIYNSSNKAWNGSGWAAPIGYTPPKIVETPKGRYTDSFRDFSVGVDASDPTQREAVQNSINSAIAAMNQNIEAYQTATPEMQDVIMRENQDYANQLRRLGYDSFQRGGQLYFNRMPGGDSQEAEGAYTGDYNMSLPDIALLRQYQAEWNSANARGDETGKKAAHDMAEKLRDKYRGYPLKDSEGYGLGENDIGFIRDMAVRTDALGGRFEDEYNRKSVTTRKYDKDGNLQYTYTSSIPHHEARMAKDMAATDRRLALQGKENNTFYTRIADPGDLALSNSDLRTKYALSGGISLGNAPTGHMGNLYDSAMSALLAKEEAGGRYSETTPMSYGGGEIGGYNGMTKQELYDAYLGIAQNQADQRNSMLGQLLAQYDAQKAQGNESFDDIARQAYIAKRQGETAMPQRLAALGISGGGSETADLQLQANYQNNLNSNEQARQQMLKDYALQELIARSQADSDISGYYSTANQSALAAWQNELQSKNSWNQWAANYALQQQQAAQSQKQWELEYALQKQQAADSLSDKEYERAWQERQYEDSLKQYALEMALKTGDYSKLAESGYNTDYLKQVQQAELEQMALEAAKLRSQLNKSGSGGGNKGKKTDNGPEITNTIMNMNGDGWVYVPGFGKMTTADLQRYVNNGAIRETILKRASATDKNAEDWRYYYTAAR